ncbi:MAG: hypothetical protein D6729_11275, partial [Deltaproteobacteria bacterium]
ALRLEVATLEAPARIERIARTRLGLVPPAPGQIVVVPERSPAAPRAAPRRAEARGPAGEAPARAAAHGPPLRRTAFATLGSDG